MEKEDSVSDGRSSGENDKRREEADAKFTFWRQRQAQAAHAKTTTLLTAIGANEGGTFQIAELVNSRTR